MNICKSIYRAKERRGQASAPLALTGAALLVLALVLREQRGLVLRHYEQQRQPHRDRQRVQHSGAQENAVVAKALDDEWRGLP